VLAEDKKELTEQIEGIYSNNILINIEEGKGAS